MVGDEELQAWFCGNILPLERALQAFIRRNWREPSEIVDLRQEIYVKVLKGAQVEIPRNAQAYLFAVARNHLITRAKSAQVVFVDILADLDAASGENIISIDLGLIARDELRRAYQGMEQLPHRCREVVRLRKVEGYSTRETASQLGISVNTVEKQLTLGMRALADFMLGGSGRVKRPTLPRTRRERQAP